MNNFFKWLIITTVYLTIIGVVEYKFHFLSTLAEMDQTKICYAIWFVAGAAAIWAMVVSFTNDPHMKRISFLSTLCQLLGLLGTVVGMIWMFYGLDLTAIDAADKDSVLNMMGSIATGISACLTTTATGIIFSILVDLYPFFIKDHSERHCDE